MYKIQHFFHAITIISFCLVTYKEILYVFIKLYICQNYKFFQNI